MNTITQIDPVAEVQLALNELYPDSTYGAVPVTDHVDALASYRGVDEDDLAEVPQAFAAYVDHQRSQWG